MDAGVIGRSINAVRNRSTNAARNRSTRFHTSSPRVKVIAEPGRYFVEASHVLFARIYAKRTLAVQGTVVQLHTIGH